MYFNIHYKNPFTINEFDFIISYVTKIVYKNKEHHTMPLITTIPTMQFLQDIFAWFLQYIQ